MPNRIFCYKCRKFMKKTRTGFDINYTGTLWIRGDEYRCPGCNQIIFGDFGEPYESTKGEEGTLRFEL